MDLFTIGLTNGPGTFMWLMNLVLRGLNWKHCLVYSDDVIVIPSAFEEHLFPLRAVFEITKGRVEIETAEVCLPSGKGLLSWSRGIGCWHQY